MSEHTERSVAAHYGIQDLGERILAALRQSGINPDSPRPEDLAPVDEFHMGGRAATQKVIGQMGLKPGMHVLDIGSGLGGLVRYLASECGCRATGIDLTPEFVDVARMLTERTGLADRADFQVGSALALPWQAATFDAATTFHVAMNIHDRATLYAEAARVLKPGAPFAIYDVMKGPTDGMLFPVPWSETAETSHLVSPAEMRPLLEQAGFTVAHEEDWSGTGLEHHRAMLARVKAAGGPPPLGLHLLMGQSRGEKSQNMARMLEGRQILVHAMIARRR